MSPPTQFTRVGTLTDLLCQEFNCFGNRTLILQPMALILPEEAREPWQGSHMRKTMLALLLPTCCLILGNHCMHTYTHAGTLTRILAAAVSTGHQTETSQNSSGINMLQIRTF